MIFDNQKGKVLQKLFLLHNILKGSFIAKNFDSLEVNTFGLFFFASCLSSTFLNGDFTFSNSFASVTWFASTCFSKTIMPFF